MPQRGDLLQSGGEADVYRVAGDADVLLKIYKKEPGIADLQRIDALIARRTPKLLEHAAWPLRRVDIDGRTALLIPFVRNGEQVHSLYDPVSRVKKFPKTDWTFAVRVAQQLATACAAIHEAGIVLVDISEKNVLVDPKGNPTLIDCDSFVFAERGPLSASVIYSEGFLPPELPVKHLAELPRQPNHDNYALARLIFKLLFQGRDPLALVPGPPQTRIFTFDREIHGLPAASEDNLTLAEIPAEIAALLNRVFATQLVALPPDAAPPSRPTAAEWAAALNRMTQRMRPCPHVETHSQIGHDTQCPWCLRAAKRPEYDVFRDRRPPPAVEPEPEPASQPPPPPRQQPWRKVAIIALLIAGPIFVYSKYRTSEPANKTPAYVPSPPLAPPAPPAPSPPPKPASPVVTAPPAPPVAAPPRPPIVSGEVSMIDIDRSQLIINGIGVRLHGIGPLTLPGRQRFATLVATKTGRVTCSSQPDASYICQYHDAKHGNRDLSRLAIRFGAARALPNAPAEYLQDDQWAEARFGPGRSR